MAACRLGHGVGRVADGLGRERARRPAARASASSSSGAGSRASAGVRVEEAGVDSPAREGRMRRAPRAGSRRWSCSRAAPCSRSAGIARCDRLPRGRAVDDQLGEHRVEGRRDLLALARRRRRSARPSPPARAAASSWPVVGTKPRVGVLGVDAGTRWRGPSARRRPASARSGSPAATRSCCSHEVEPGDHLGHRMLDLQARVHLQEVELAVAPKMNSTVPALR